MVDKEEIRKTPSPLNINEAIEGDALNQKTARILKNDLLLYEAVIKNEADTVRKVLKETVDVDSRNNKHIRRFALENDLVWTSANSLGSIEGKYGDHRDVDTSEMRHRGKRQEINKHTIFVFGMRPLHMAARYGHRDAVKMLINAGANVSAVNKVDKHPTCLLQKQYTLLMCAARGNNVRVVEYLAEAVESLNGDATDCTGATALHHAASAGHPSMITALSNVPRIELNATDKYREFHVNSQKGQTPIHCACAEEHLEAVEVLIALGVNVDAQDHEGNTPLHVATRTRHTAIAQLLLRAGANTELIDENVLDHTFFQIGFTPLHVAASQGCKGILESMIQHGAALNKQCKRLQSPFHIATEIGHNDICKLLLAAGANIEQRDQTQNLQESQARRERRLVCRWILTELELKRSLSGCSQSGKTPLYIAARGSFTAIVDMIIKTARLDYPTPEDSMSDKEIRDLTPARRRWREGSRGESISSNNSVLSEHIRSILWKLAYKQLGPEDWKKLALHWAFTNDQIRAIEHQYTGLSLELMTRIL
ncbi:Ankyrin repeat and death domain-containing protein [Apis cerana cerana]|uniref:Ankyrin repeat and death domain-containing protein n=1 Tax=Apis cerana cerana TaxID=94128 RepID=A0A2A3EC92_APICC|nr:Ankyrin repeat and death domain-containing protein [Apis cerana cerana]